MSDTLAPAEPGANAAAPAAMMNRFINASAERTEPFWDSGEVTLGGSAVELNNIEIPAQGYLSGILAVVEIISTGNTAAVTADADSPFSVIKDVTHSDVNGAQLFGRMSGFQWYLSNKYGGYSGQAEPKNSPNYSAVETGGGATGGSGKFALRIPVQVNPRDAYGSLPNMNAASTFRLGFTLAELSDVFGTAPDGDVKARIRLTAETWMVPGAQDGMGVMNSQTPPGNGSYQRWVRNVMTVTAGDNTHRLPNVSNFIRTLVFVARDGSGDRSNAVLPDDQIALDLDGYTRTRQSKDVFDQYLWERYGQQPDTGVFVIDYTHELDGIAGFETRELWLPTNSATRLEVKGDFDAAGTLEVLTNDVIPVGDHRAA